MPSSHFRSSHDRTTSGMACHHRPWTENMVERHRSWHYITASGQHTRSNDIGCGKPSSPLGSTHGRMTSGVACHHSPWMTNTIEQRRAWHAITAFGQHTHSNDVGRSMSSWPLESTQGRTMSGVACHHSPWMTNTDKRCRARHAIIAFGLADRVGRHQRSMLLSPLYRKHGQTTSGVACHHGLTTAHTVE